jgi:hypothetical protein
MKVYAFMYNPMIHESASAVISLHKTIKGAEMAMEFDKAERKKEWDELYKNLKAPCDFGLFEYWCIKEYEILE